MNEIGTEENNDGRYVGSFELCLTALTQMWAFAKLGIHASGLGL